MENSRREDPAPPKSMAKQDSTTPFSMCKWAGRTPARMLKCQVCLKATVLNEHSAGVSLLTQGTQSTLVTVSSQLLGTIPRENACQFCNSDKVMSGQSGESPSDIEIKWC